MFLPSSIYLIFFPLISFLADGICRASLIVGELINLGTMHSEKIFQFW